MQLTNDRRAIADKALALALISTTLIYATTYLLYRMDLTEIFSKLKDATPMDYAWAVGCLVCLRMLDSFSAYIAVKREARIARAEGREPVKWSSHTFTEKLFIKMGFYAGMIIIATMLYLFGFGNYGITAAVLASAYAEILSLYENSIRAGIKWPAVFEAVRKKADSLLKVFVKK